MRHKQRRQGFARWGPFGVGVWGMVEERRVETEMMLTRRSTPGEVHLEPRGADIPSDQLSRSSTIRQSGNFGAFRI